MDKRFIRISSRDSRYLEYDDGNPYIPLGINLCFPRFVREESEALEYFQRHFKALADNGGNFVRIWLSSPFFELESVREGQYEIRQLRHIAAVVEMAGELGLKIKFTLEHFRKLEACKQAERFPGAASFEKKIYHHAQGGSFENTEEFMSSAAGKALFLSKLDILAEHFADSPAIMAWELWNEVNCCGQPAVWKAWTEAMLPELKRRFPRHLALQSLGSFDSLHSENIYNWLSSLPDNDCIQAHRYLDPGAELDVCKKSLDVLSADAIRRLREYAQDKPLLLAEGGAVESGHSRPSHLYENDSCGHIMHDVLFAPFFAGAAGGGQIWHWEEYVIPHQLWNHLSHLGKALEGIDPAEEDFCPRSSEQSNLRLYILKGRNHTLVWCRDMNNTWHSELEQGHMPKNISGTLLDIDCAETDGVDWYSPWTGLSNVAERCGQLIKLPDFERSLVLKINHKGNLQ
eukprot:TRINITY_DN20939_c0_g1_i1.p1 TRINITY_DN20939_c0_g1~~TRINITY_DN20939_c0_g1_i1.p1  ORF type:complete len:459 (-),score=76.61 TRINITY_DN20939_c0_g1_i1:10-1386(-)